MYRITLIVNDEKFLICSKLCRIELFEAEFNIKLFVLAEFNAFNEADQQLPAGAGTFPETLNQCVCFLLRFGGGFFFLLQFLALILQPGSVGFHLAIDSLEVVFAENTGELIHVHSV